MSGIIKQLITFYVEHDYP